MHSVRTYIKMFKIFGHWSWFEQLVNKIYFLLKKNNPVFNFNVFFFNLKPESTKSKANQTSSSAIEIVSILNLQSIIQYKYIFNKKYLVKTPAPVYSNYSENKSGGDYVLALLYLV